MNKYRVKLKGLPDIIIIARTFKDAIINIRKERKIIELKIMSITFLGKDVRINDDLLGNENLID